MDQYYAISRSADTRTSPRNLTSLCDFLVVPKLLTCSVASVSKNVTQSLKVMFFLLIKRFIGWLFFQLKEKKQFQFNETRTEHFDYKRSDILCAVQAPCLGIKIALCNIDAIRNSILVLDRYILSFVKRKNPLRIPLVNV
jgi:hypothetical protein